jgi:oligopeptide/dipeptide ABC transporter ATP-binding protein
MGQPTFTAVEVTATSPRPSAVGGHSDPEPVLSVRDLHVEYHTDAGVVRAVNGVTFDVMPGQKLGLVGESGSGKSTIALALMRMIRSPGRITSGQIVLAGRDIVTVTEREMRQVRSREIGMIPQGAMNSLNPVARVEDQIIDTIQDHATTRVTKKDLIDRARTALESVGLRPDAARMYPHELSGGMKQRVCIAIALAMQPKIVIADEPTSALDVVVQRQVMDTIMQLQEDLGIAVILIGHDMGLMAQSVDQLAVMYGGKLAEVSPIFEIFADPLHPYTELLIESLPKLEDRGTFRGIPGLPPSLQSLPPGCLFHPRCPKVLDVCREDIPTFAEHRPRRFAACHLHEERHGTATD